MQPLAVLWDASKYTTTRQKEDNMTSVEGPETPGDLNNIIQAAASMNVPQVGWLEEIHQRWKDVEEPEADVLERIQWFVMHNLS